MAHWIGKFQAWLFPEIRPLHGRGPKWITLQGGPAAGKKLKLTLRVGDTLSVPIARTLSIRELAMAFSVREPWLNIATYRLENVLDERHRMRLTGIYKGMKD